MCNIFEFLGLQGNRNALFTTVNVFPKRMHINNLQLWSHEADSSPLIPLACAPPPRAHLCALPNGGEHLRRLRRGRLPGGRLLLHLPAA